MRGSGGLAVGDGAVWVACEDDDAVGRIDPASEEMVSEIEVRAGPRFVTFAFEGVWVSNYLDGTITRIDPATGGVVAEVRTAEGPQIMLDAGGGLWVSCTDADLVQRIDPATDRVEAEISAPLAPDGLAFDGSSIVWVATEVGPQLLGIDVSTGEHVTATLQVAEERAIDANQVVLFENGSLWLPILARGVVLRVIAQGTIAE